MAPHKVGFHLRKQKVVHRCQIWRVRGVVMNGNAFLSEKLLDDSSAVERSIIVQEEPVT